MTDSSPLMQALGNVLVHYRVTFSDKVYTQENNATDLLMDVFGITPGLKRENRQYWGRELGMCWQRLVIELFRHTRDDFGPALRYGADEPCDLTVAAYAIDTKYRIGSGDSGTLKKFRAYAPLLRDKGYEPTLLIVREDNLPAAIAACKSGGWNVLTGEATFDFIRTLSGFDLRDYLRAKAQEYKIVR